MEISSSARRSATGCRRSTRLASIRWQVRLSATVRAFPSGIGWRAATRERSSRVKSRPSAGAAAYQVRAGDQPQDGESSRPHGAARLARPRRRDDRITASIGGLCGGSAAAVRRSSTMRLKFVVSLFGCIAFITLTTALSAEPARRMPAVGVLNYAGARDVRVVEFLDALRELGYVEG